MSADPEAPKYFRFGQVTLDLVRGTLRNDAGDIPLRPKCFEVLRILVESAGCLVEKERLLKEVWNRSTVTNDSLTQCVVDIRRAIGDSGRETIKTVPRRGYVFDAPVVAFSNDSESSIEPKANRGISLRTALGVLAVIVLVAGIGMYRMPGIAPPPYSVDESAAVQHSIAVLPFENRIANPDDAYLVDGMHDDVLIGLARIDSLLVIPRTSVEQLTDGRMSIPKIREALGATAVLEGFVQRVGDDLRVNVKLIDAESDSMIWADSYDRRLSAANVSAVQREIASSIAFSVRASLSAAERQRIDKVQTTHLAAYESYQNGVVLLERRTGESLKGAIEFFREATHLDPGFALAYVGLADARQLLISHAESTAAEVLPSALAAAQTAIELDGNVGEAYASLGAIFNEAEKHRVNLGVRQDPEHFFKRALELSPNYGTAYQWYGEYLQRTQGHEAAIEQYQVAVTLEPLSPIINHILADALASSGRLSEAEKHWLRAIDVDPGFSRGHQGLAALYFSRTGQLAEAAVAARKAVLLNPSGSVNAALLANIYINLGDDAQAAYWLREGKKGQSDHPILQAIVAFRHVMRGDEARAGNLLEELNRAARIPRLTFHLLNDHYVRTGNFAAALNLCESRYPEIFASDPATYIESLMFVAADCAMVLTRLARHDEARPILNRIRQLIDQQTLAKDNRIHVLAAAIHTMDGENSLAVRRLRQAIDSGWRYFVPYYLDHSPSFAGIRESTEFQALASDYRALLAAERQKLEMSLLASAETNVYRRRRANE